ncbi:type II toxin-antitoxin system Phd/YefM family antitoxin [Arthrobacter sp. RIT-PI-e]|uniref:type II toxin-antitoxin system Phd/YefM family antitoxin n=1 Tax=Arthrobacter sp. RIT-PI-e TaxID=1681197 RepID=UPI0009E1D153|nr:prevent-host-death protein antitoxin of TAS system [Arthrobacter sp. RIT-PI-e]
MTTTPHREFRDQSSRILERVKNGETISVTENGEVMATPLPPSRTPFEQLLRSGRILPATPYKLDFRALSRITIHETTTHLLADCHGEE